MTYKRAMVILRNKGMYSAEKAREAAIYILDCAWADREDRAMAITTIGH